MWPYISEEPETQQDLRDLQSGAPVVLAGHPAFQHGPTLLPVLSKYPGQAAALRTISRVLIRPHYNRPLRGLHKLQDRLTTHAARDASLSVGLHRTTWESLSARTWGLTEYQRFFWYRLVLGAFNLRDPTGLPVGCPHQSCRTEEPATLTHIFWSCPGARAFWDELLPAWSGAARSATYTDDERRQSIFSRTPPPARPVVEQTLHAASSTVRVARTNQQRIWGCICSVAAHHIWHLRNDALFREIAIPTDGRTRSIWRAVENQLRSLLVKGQTTAAAGLPHFDAFWTALRSDEPLAAPPAKEARLYFDGGARGNPGIAGSGSVIVERTSGDDHWNIVWWKASYLGDSHTNNTAEHAALQDGLAECAARYHEEIVRVLIVGDSHLVLSQLLGTARCKIPHLRHLLEHSSQLLRTLKTVQVRHTLRTGNAMADYLANMAMNTKSSHRSNSNWSPTDEHLTRLLPNDTVHPHTDITAIFTKDLLECTRRHIQYYEADDATSSEPPHAE